jgi:hypothetical protein
MRNLILFFLFFVSFVSGQTKDHVQFDYDNAGNQIKRYLIDIFPGKQASPNSTTQSNPTESDLIKADIYDDVKYYPNPVQEELYVQWEKVDENYVDNVSIFSMTGQLMRRYENLRNETSTTLAFYNYPQGYYTVLLVYANGENKTLKIVKR